MGAKLLDEADLPRGVAEGDQIFAEEADADGRAVGFGKFVAQ